jgi:hypothetical protein
VTQIDPRFIAHLQTIAICSACGDTSWIVVDTGVRMPFCFDCYESLDMFSGDLLETDCAVGSPW